MFTMKNGIMKRIGAALLSGACAISVLTGNLGGIAAKAAETEAFPSADALISKASSLLGTSYSFGFKGYTGVYYANAYKPMTEENIRKQGIDCSGLVYYTLTQLGFKTSGFSWNNPVPVDTAHWLTYNKKCTVTYNGVTTAIDCEKQDVATEKNPYWQCADGSTIAPGSVVIAEKESAANHAWIYLGEFVNRAAVVDYLKSIGVAEKLITSATVGDGGGAGGTHWRIESKGGKGVIINNDITGKTAIAMNCTAFRFTSRDASYRIQKVRKTDNVTITSDLLLDSIRAIYGVYTDSDCKNKVGEITVGNDGTGAIELPAKQYYVKEIVAPTGYELSDKVFLLKENETVFVTEAEEQGRIKISKSAEDGVTSGFEFMLSWKDSGVPHTKSAVTDADGLAVFDELDIFDFTTKQPIVYTVSETHVNARYEVPKSQNVTLNDGDVDLTVNLDFVNKLKKFTAEVNKQDAETKSAQGNATLAGAVYGLYQGETLMASYTTDKNGCFKTGEFVCGNDWTIREITPSEGYLLDETVYPVGAEAKNYTLENNTISMNVYETPVKGKIDIIKHSDDGTTGIETPEKGAEFEVHLKSAGSYEVAADAEKDYLVCDGNGYAATKMLPYGVYVVHQTKGWESTEWLEDFEVNICENGKTYFYLLNDAVLTSYLKIVKKDAESGRIIPAAGIGFQVWSCEKKSLVNQTVMYPNEQTVDTFYTDSTGTLMLPNALAYGDYELREVLAPNGYFLDDEAIPFKIDGKVQTLTVEKYNTPQKGRISVYKSGDAFASVDVKDVAGNPVYTPVFKENPLSGAAFEIVAAADIITADGMIHAKSGDVVATLTTDENGYAESELLYLGKYEIREMIAPYGYVRNSKVQDIELTYAGQEIEVRETVKTVFENEYQGIEIKLSKFMERDELFGTPDEMAKVRFGLFAAEEITAADDTVIPADGFICEVKLDENMTAIIAEKLPFARYYVQEIATGESYVLSGEKFMVNFEYLGQEVDTVSFDCGQFTNRLKRGNVNGKKVNESNEPLSGAIFGLFPKMTTAFTKDSAIMTAESDTGGCFSFTDIPYGEYIVREIAAPDGYILSDERYPVVISGDGDIIEIAADNKPTTVKLWKRDMDTGEALAGASMQLLDEAGNVVDAWIYTTEVHTITAILTAGKTYILREIEAPNGYMLSEDVSFTVSEDGSIDEITMFDAKIPPVEAPPASKTGDDSSKLPGIVMVTAGILIFVALFIVRKKKGDDTDFSELCPDSIEKDED